MSARKPSTTKSTLKQAEPWSDAPADSPKGKRLDVLTLLIADYEARHFPMEPPDPIKFLLFFMEQRGLSRKNLEPFIGSRAGWPQCSIEYGHFRLK